MCSGVGGGWGRPKAGAEGSQGKVRSLADTHPYTHCQLQHPSTPPSQHSLLLAPPAGPAWSKHRRPRPPPPIAPRSHTPFPGARPLPLPHRRTAPGTVHALHPPPHPTPTRTSSGAGDKPSLQPASPGGHISTTTRSSRTAGVMRVLLKKVYSRMSVLGPKAATGRSLRAGRAGGCAGAGAGGLTGSFRGPKPASGRSLRGGGWVGWGGGKGGRCCTHAPAHSLARNETEQHGPNMPGKAAF